MVHMHWFNIIGRLALHILNKSSGKNYVLYIKPMFQILIIINYDLASTKAMKPK